MRFNLPRLIGITGKAGSGKDTLADYLVRQHGFEKYSLSAPIKRLLNERFGWTDNDWLDREWKERPNPACGAGPFTRAQLGTFSPRSWAQWLGTEVGRIIGGEDVWINMIEREWNTAKTRVVISDVRYDNEAARILSLGGVIIRIVRRNATQVAAHVSEKGVSDELVNIQVRNDTDINKYLKEAVYGLQQCPRGAVQTYTDLRTTLRFE